MYIYDCTTDLNEHLYVDWPKVNSLSLDRSKSVSSEDKERFSELESGYRGTSKEPLAKELKMMMGGESTQLRCMRINNQFITNERSILSHCATHWKGVWER